MLPLTLETLPFDPPGGWHAFLPVIAAQPWAVIFDSAQAGEAATHSYAAFAPIMLLQCTGQTARFQRGRNASVLEGNPLDIFERVERFTADECPLRECDAQGFIGGWAGLLGFDLRGFIEKLPPPKPDGPLFPDLQAGFYPWVLAHDHAAGTTELRLLNGAPGGPEDIARLAADLAALTSQETAATELSPPDLLTTREQWCDGVNEIKRLIFEGDIYQANLTRMVRRQGAAHGPSLYARLRAANPAPFAGYLDCGDGRAILSSSPERFVSVRDGVIETRPIKGTRPRGRDATEDARLRDELAASVKDRAELTMIVDLERNDLGRVCVPGSVRVPSLMHLTTHEGVHHLEATVKGKLREDVTPTGLIRAVFPGGSISGAPKKRALEVIHALEPVRRGPYTGCMFRLGVNGDFDSNILIRTLLVEPDSVSYHVGCGIVADSDAEAEWAESHDKAARLEAAFEARA
jgi:para-aminobenzoate synthetase component 1